MDDESFFGESYWSEEANSDDDSIGKNSQLNAKSSIDDSSHYMNDASNSAAMITGMNANSGGMDPNARTGQNTFKIDEKMI